MDGDDSGGMVHEAVSSVEGSAPRLNNTYGKTAECGIDVMDDTLSQSTWGGYATAWQQMTEFTNTNLRTGITEEAALIYLTARLTGTGTRRLSLSSTASYGRRLQAVAGRTDQGWNGGLMRDFLQSLRRNGSDLPEHQADPLPKELLYQVLVGIDPHLRVLLYCMWKTASRADDFSGEQRGRLPRMANTPAKHMTVSCFTRIGQNQIRVHFPSTKTGVLEEVAIIEGETPWIEEVSAYLNQRRSTSRFTNLTTADVAEALPPGYTAHSIKRGAIEHLVRAGVPLERIHLLSKHRDPAREISPMLRRYMSEEALGMGQRTWEMTRLL